MSFFSRLGNLVAGMANNMLDTIEHHNPEITREYKSTQTKKHIRTLTQSLQKHKRISMMI